MANTKEKISGRLLSLLQSGPQCSKQPCVDLCQTQNPLRSKHLEVGLPSERHPSQSARHRLSHVLWEHLRLLSKPSHLKCHRWQQSQANWEMWNMKMEAENDEFFSSSGFWWFSCKWCISPRSNEFHSPLNILKEKFTFRTAGKVDVKGISPCMAFFAAFWIDLGTFHSFGWPASCLFHVDI